MTKLRERDPGVRPSVANRTIDGAPAAVDRARAMLDAGSRIIADSLSEDSESFLLASPQESAQ